MRYLALCLVILLSLALFGLLISVRLSILLVAAGGGVMLLPALYQLIKSRRLSANSKTNEHPLRRR